MLTARSFDEPLVQAPLERVVPLVTSASAQPGTATAITYELVETRRAFDSLEPEWSALFERAASGRQIFQGFNWLWHWANHFLPHDRSNGLSLAIVIGRSNGRLVFVWPLVARKRGPVTVLTWMGEPVSQYGDVLIDKTVPQETVLREAFAYLRANLSASLLHLRKVRADCPLAPILAEFGATVHARLDAPYLDLGEAETFVDYEKRYSSSARKNRRRQRRRFEERGESRLLHLTQGPEARRLSGIAIDLKRSWLESRSLVSPAISDDRTKAFFADVAEAADHPAGCRVLALTSGGRPAAIEISLVAKGHAAIHIIAYDQDFEKAAAGSLLMEDSIASAYATGCTTFDLMAPGDAYKLDWADKTIDVCDWVLPLDMLGKTYETLYLGVLRNFGKRAVKRLPKTVRDGVSYVLLAAASRSRGKPVEVQPDDTP